MRKPSIARPPVPVRSSGFALVITLSLMVLLTVIAVGLMSISSISLRSASRGDAMAAARSNARLALVLAIGELQTFAGPDQRITATADLAGTETGDGISSGAAPLNNSSVNSISKGLSSVQSGTRYWTGVWRNSNLTNPGIDIYTRTPSPTHLQWLVSGNESSANPAFNPSSPDFSVSGDGSVSDPSTAVVLVGPGSVGSASSAADNYVAVPLVEMEAEGNRGRYAWWIGDEGVKTKFNRNPAMPEDAVENYHDLVTRRSGWESVAGLESYPAPGSGDPGMLDRVVTLGQGELIARALDPTVTGPQSIFHSATTDGFGVLSDTLQGGLRIDLTSTLENGLPATALSNFPNSPALNANIIPSSLAAARQMKGPKWGRIESFYNMGRSITDGKISVTGGSSVNDPTVAPIIADLRLLLGARLAKVDDTQYQIHPCGKVAIALANPYPYTLEWSSNLELRLLDETPTTNNRSSRIWDASGTSAFFSNKGEPAVFNNATFVIPAGDLPPGEARAYTMVGQVVRPAGNTAAIRVDLKPFAGSGASNFASSIIQQDSTANSGSKLLDVRESWTTTQITAELRMSGSGSGGGLLRRLERFELDNGFFGTMRRSVSRATADTMTQPFPMHLYSFQLSQPGNDYQTLLPSADLMGTRSSTVRTFTDFNLQAVRFGKLITSYNPPPYFMESSDSLATLPFTTPGGETGSGFTKNLAVTPLPWGRASVGNVRKTILFSFPRDFASLAQLQHADLTGDDNFTSVCHQPGNAVGNSYATPFVKRRQTIQRRDNYIVTGSGGGENQTSTKTSVNYYDLSYLLNAALWDSYFFSTIENGEPRNKGLVVAKPGSDKGELEDPLKASSHLLIDSAFNINSTNKNAWKALLAGNRYLKHPADGSGSGTDAMFPRSLEQPGTGQSTPSGNGDDSYSGYRRLSDAQLDAVAEEMVRQVRLRGPFVSLSHFVNRALVNMTARRSPNTALSSSGALQSALDIGGANISPDGRKSGFAPTLNVTRDKLALKSGSGKAPVADLWGGQANGSRGTTYGGTTDDGFPVWAAESKDLNVGAMGSIYADRLMLTEAGLRPEQGYRSTGIPGWITQADILQSIGPVISARSDTFRIRSYGESLSPDGKTVLARAWCEAVVQRMPSYVDPSNLPSERASSPSDSALSLTNRTFGRKFEVLSFRWLASHEI